MKVLPRSFYRRDTGKVAKELLGKVLVRYWRGKRLSGRIVEVEAYFEDDPASHAFRGETPRNKPMFEEEGRAYVYFIYGNHYCLNVVTERAGVAGAVLIRALEPIEGIKLMQRAREVPGIENLTNGPGKLTQAFRIGKKENRADLVRGDLVIEEGKKEKFKIVATGRIGITEAKSRPLRFYIYGNKFVSRS